MTPREIIRPIQGTGADVVPLPLPSLDQAREFIRASKAENTLRGYQSDWREFCAWCGGHGVCPLPAAAGNRGGAPYIAECAGRLKPGSIQRRLNAIAEAHKAAGVESTTHNAIVRNTMKGNPVAYARDRTIEEDGGTNGQKIRTMLELAD